MNAAKQENYFVVIPYPVLTDQDLSDVDKLVYAEISALCNKDGYCYASNNYIGGILNKNKRSIQRAIEALKKASYIRVVLSAKDNNGTLRQIFLSATMPMTNLTIPHDKNVTPPMTKMSTKNISKDNKLDKLAHAQKIETPKDGDNLGKTGMQPIRDIIVERTNLRTGKNAETMRFSVDPVKTAHQAYGLEAVDQLNLPSSYKGRIIGSCKDMPLHRIENAVEATLKKALQLKDAEERAKYFFTVLHSNG